MRGLKRARNRPPLPWRWWEYGSERPDSSENHQAVLKTPTRSAEPPHTANGAEEIIAELTIRTIEDWTPKNRIASMDLRIYRSFYQEWRRIETSHE